MTKGKTGFAHCLFGVATLGLRSRAPLRSALLLPWILYFIVAGVLLLPYPGIENDEALFAGGIYTPDRMEASFRLFDTPVCTMIMSYIGALKAWLYAPVFLLWRPSPVSLWLPVILCGALTVWLFVCLLKWVAGRRAAVFVGYTQGNEMFLAAKQPLFRCAREAGFRREVLEVIRDRNGRPIFEVYKFRRQAANTPDPDGGEAGS